MSPGPAEAGDVAMGLILPILVLGLLASLSPSTLVVFILLLATTRARINAGAFLIGWAISVTVVFAVSYGLGAFHPTGHGSTAVAVDIAEILLGIALVALA